MCPVDLSLTNTVSSTSQSTVKFTLFRTYHSLKALREVTLTRSDACLPTGVPEARWRRSTYARRTEVRVGQIRGPRVVRHLSVWPALVQPCESTSRLCSWETRWDVDSTHRFEYAEQPKSLKRARTFSQQTRPSFSRWRMARGADDDGRGATLATETVGLVEGHRAWPGLFRTPR